MQSLLTLRTRSRTIESGSGQRDSAGRAGHYLTDHHTIVDQPCMLGGACHEQTTRCLWIGEQQAVFLGAAHPGVADELRKTFRFYDWDNATGEVRWMCAWDTTEDDVDAFADAIKAAVT